MLADIFINIVPIAGCPFGMSGNMRVSTGDSSRDMKLINPPCSPMRMMPIQSDSTPVSPNEISNAVLADENVESMTAGNTSMSPKHSIFTADTTKAITKNEIQM